MAEARKTALRLLDARAAGVTICPSEVAKALADQHRTADWRSSMPDVHRAVDELVAEGTVQLSWKGQHLTQRAGPYRIRRKASE